MDNNGYFVNWELTAANVDDRKPVEELLQEAPARQVLAEYTQTSMQLSSWSKWIANKLALRVRILRNYLKEARFGRLRA